MPQLRTVKQKYVTQMTNPSTPHFQKVALPTPLRIDAPADMYEWIADIGDVL